MKTSSSLLFDATFVLVLALFAAQGARGYDPDSPGGRMLERYRTRVATVGDRFVGAALLAMAIGGLLWFVHHLLDGAF